MPVLRSSRRPAAVAITVGALVSAGLSAASPAPAADRAGRRRLSPTSFGLPIGNPKANNAKVIKRLAPIVVRYAR